MTDKIVHLSPSNLNAWDELRKAGDDSPPWVNPESFKDSIMGVFTPSKSASAGNACHEYILGNHSEGAFHHTENNWKFFVESSILKARNHFDYGFGVPEVPKVKYLPDRIKGYQVRISGRTDYLSKSLITDVKTSSRPFSGKGKTRSFLESQQSFSYTLTYGLPIRFVFVEIAMKEADGIINILTKNISSSTAYPSASSDMRLIECVDTLIPYLMADDDMWYKVTNRTLADEF